MKKILTAKKLFKSYGDLQVLKNINIEIKDNEIVAIVGPSGAGKTTLLHILGTLDRPDNKKESSLTIDQINITNLSSLKKAITLMPLFLVINVILMRIFHYLIHSTWADFRLLPDSHIPKKLI